MRRAPAALTAAIVTGATVLAVLAHAQPVAPKTPMSAAEKKKAYAATLAAAPGPTEQHKLLRAFVGNFDVNVEVAIDAGEPMKAHSIEKGESIAGGLFVKVESTAAPDEELKGDRMVVYGYDAAAGKYTLWCVETGNARPTTATGDYDAATRTFTFEGELAQSPTVKMPYRWTLHVQDNGTIDQQIFLKPPGSTDFRKLVGAHHLPKK